MSLAEWRQRLVSAGPVPIVSAALALFALLKPLFDARLIQSEAVGASKPARVATRSHIAALLSRHDLHAAVEAARHAYHAVGLELADFHAPFSLANPDRLLAAMLIPVRASDVAQDSAASMANHLEALCHGSPLTLELHADLAKLPHVQCLTDKGEKGKPTRLVVTSLSEGHRLASSYFLDERARVVTNGTPSDKTFISQLRSDFGVQDLGKKTHPLPGDWWNVFKTIYKYDPNALVHGILFPSLGIKIPRVLTAHHEAFGAARVGSSGVKFDKLGKTTSRQPIFAVDEETAREIRATFILDLSLLRSFGRRTKNGEKEAVSGLSERQKQFLLEFAFWKIARLLAAPFRFRSTCDLRLSTLTWVGGDASDPNQAKDIPLELSDLNSDIKKAIEAAGFEIEQERVTQVYWPSEELFKPGKDTEQDSEDADEESGDTEGDEQS